MDASMHSQPLVIQHLEGVMIMVSVFFFADLADADTVRSLRH